MPIRDIHKRREYMRNYKRAYYARLPEEKKEVLRAQSRAWRKAHPQQCASIALRYYHRKKIEELHVQELSAHLGIEKPLQSPVESVEVEETR